MLNVQRPGSAHHTGIEDEDEQEDEDEPQNSFPIPNSPPAPMIYHQLRQLAYGFNPIAWFENYGRIKTKTVGPALDRPPAANPMQEEIGRAVNWCLHNDQPIRLIIYKPRQKGCSTGNVAIVYARARTQPMNCLIIGGQASQTTNLWNILRHYAKLDRCPWGNTWTDTQTTATCNNGSTFTRETAGDKEAGRSGTYHAVIATEVARWPNDGARNAHEVLNSVLNCVPNLPGTIVILESTACGPVGPFPSTWAGAVTLPQMQAGHKGNGYLRIFAPWHRFPDSTMPLTPQEKHGLRDKLTAAADTKALRLMDELGLAPESIAYYHHLLSAPECGGDPMKRDREYPTTPEDGFQASSPSRFNLEALDQLDAYARTREPDLRHGTLELHPDERLKAPERRDYRRTAWITASPAQCEFALIEDRIPGCAYLIATDNMKGASHVTGADPDCNAVAVLRDGWFDRHHRWHPPEIVASLYPTGWGPHGHHHASPGNRWDMDILAEAIARLSGYFGNAIVVPESNRGEFLISELRKRRVPLWLRERPKDRVDLYEDTGLIGFNTSPESKKTLVENLARHLRELHQPNGGFRCPFPWINSEFRTFIRHKDGTEGALKITGCHDDQVIATALALLCKNAATPYHPATQHPSLIPADLRDNEVRREVW